MVRGNAVPVIPFIKIGFVESPPLADFQQNQFWGLLRRRRSKPQNWFHNENC
ncbi:hypothetical protein APA_332 [Pseudanabaena sp. lw0831]|nr:hypothetical protein APA_332 [Pseudanabaena sp. lw0831]